MKFRDGFKPNRRLTGGSVRFRAVSIVLNKDNRLEPDGTGGRPTVRFWSRPLVLNNISVIFRGVARLSTSGGQERNISSFFNILVFFSPIFPKFSPIFFLNLVLRVGNLNFTIIKEETFKNGTGKLYWVCQLPNDHLRNLKQYAFSYECNDNYIRIQRGKSTYQR